MTLDEVKCFGDIIELLIERGADPNKTCEFLGEEQSPKQFCMKMLEALSSKNGNDELKTLYEKTLKYGPHELHKATKSISFANKTNVSLLCANSKFKLNSFCQVDDKALISYSKFNAM